MTYFIATVLSKGKKEDYGYYAETKKEAHYLAKIKFSGIIIKVAESEPPLEEKFKQFKASLTKNMRKKKIKQDALIASTRQLAVMTNAGIPINDSIKEIARSASDNSLKDIFLSIADDINSGHSLSHAMGNYRFELGNLTLAMIELGEKTGNVADALYSLSNMLEEIRANVIKFKKAMAYPRNVMIAMAIAFTILISYVVPKFKAIFEQLHAELPLPTIILLKLEYIFNNFGPYVLAALFISFMIFRFMINNYRNVRYNFHKFLLKIYLIKNIIMYATLSRFTLVFAELIRAGIPIAEALDTSISMVDNLPLKDKLSSVRATVEKGGNLHNGLKETDLFENMIIQMVSAGESSGQLDSMMQKVAEYYKMKFDAIIDGLAEAVEPIMLIIIASMVLLLALGIFLPMWNLGQAVNGSH
ncbi:MAG: type II secretion system F family protein [Thiovulaceae bacterium]|nr:type II secretion system F family protein [Sulfurimonadaceae bacterium]